MTSKELGLIKKYNVERVDSKPVDDCIVLEFKDPIAHPALRAWAEEMWKNGYTQVHKDVLDKIQEYK